MAKSNFTLKTSPGHLLRRAQQYSYDLYSKEVGSKGPTPRQFAVLHTVSENEGLSQTDLVRRTGIDRSTLADMISRLIKKGYLGRERTKTDARANSVKITAAGRKVLTAAQPKVVSSESAVLAVLPKTQQSQFMKALTTFAEALDKIEEAAAAPAKRKPGRKPAAKKKTAAKKPGRKPAAKKTTRRTTMRAAASATRAPVRKAPVRKTTTRRTTTTRA
ncbi:MAG: MarR family transcriptional regulator, partial [Pseudomonadota bacterium]